MTDTTEAVLRERDAAVQAFRRAVVDGEESLHRHGMVSEEDILRAETEQEARWTASPQTPQKPMVF